MFLSNKNTNFFELFLSEKTQNTRNKNKQIDIKTKYSNNIKSI